MGRSIVCVVLILVLFSLKTGAQQQVLPLVDSSLYNRPLLLLPQNFYNQHLGFFCKKESQLQKLTKLPLYFRLGSKNYVDYLERKPNAKAF